MSVSKPYASSAPADPAEPTSGYAGDARGTSRKKIYAVGSLRYGTEELVILFVWLLWGDFCSTMFQGIFGNFLPLFLRHLQASNTLIAFLSSGVGGLLNLLFLPNISMASDRYRSRRGRRIPFLFWSTPVAALALIGIGFSQDVALWLHGTVGALQVFSPARMTLFIVAMLVILYAMFLMITNNVYQFLLRDVVPHDVMPWFLSMFRIIGVMAGCLFQWFLFRYIVDHPKTLCMGVGLTYLLSFLLICSRVKEGEYPPPSPRTGNANPILGAMQSYLRYFRECLSVAIYRNYIFVFVLQVTATTATASFTVLFGTETLKISPGNYGKILALGTFLSGGVYLLMGFLCKRFHAIRVTMASLSFSAIGSAAALLFVRSKTGFVVYTVIMVFPTVGWLLGSIAVMMMLFPAEKFGQFSSSLMAIGWGSLALTSYLVGKLMDFFGGNYRMVFLVSLSCYALAVVPMLQVYRGWKQHGGPNQYVPPLPSQGNCEWRCAQGASAIAE